MFDRCHAWRSLLTRRAEGVLSPSERALLEDHVAKCVSCRAAQQADDALHALSFSHDTTLPEGLDRAFDDRIIAELRALPLSDTPTEGWRERVRGCFTCISFEFCMQLAGGGLAAAAVTAFALVSALNPVSTPKNPSEYEVRSLSAAERNEPPVPLESLFQSPAPRAAMLWAAPGSTRWRPASGNRGETPQQQPPASRNNTVPRRHGARPVRPITLG